MIPSRPKHVVVQCHSQHSYFGTVTLQTEKTSRFLKNFRLPQGAFSRPSGKNEGKWAKKRRRDHLIDERCTTYCTNLLAPYTKDTIQINSDTASMNTQSRSLFRLQGRVRAFEAPWRPLDVHIFHRPPQGGRPPFAPLDFAA